MARQRDDHARIDAAGQIRADRHIRPQPLFDRVQQHLLEVIDQPARIVAALLVARVWKIHFPISALGDRGRRAAVVRGSDLQIMTRRQELHAFEAGDRSGQCGERKDLIDAAQIGPGRHHARGEQRLDFRCEEKAVALPRPVERRDAEAVAPELELALALVPKRDRKLPAEPLPHLHRMLLPHVRNDLGVAMGDQPMAAARQLGAPFEVIEKLAIEHDRDAPVFVGHGLLAIRQADDAQPPRSQRDAGTIQKAFLVRAAMHDGTRHFFDDALGNAAHGLSLKLGACPPGALFCEDVHSKNGDDKK